MHFARLLPALVGAAACLPLVASAACADENYVLNLSVINSQFSSSEAGTRCENTAERFFDLLSNSGFSSIVSNYDANAFVDARANFNSLPLSLRFDEESTVLFFNVPELGIVELAFDPGTAGTRDDAADLLVDYIKKSGILAKILEYQAEHSPSSPITGPGGMIPSAAAGDFDAAMGDTLREIHGGSDSPTLALGAAWGSMDLDGKKGEVTNLPLSRVWRSTEVPGRVFTLSGALTEVKLAGATSYHGGVGVALRMPVSARWALTPSLRYAVTGSADMTTAAGLYSIGLASTYHIPLARLDLVIGNMAGYHETTKVSIGDYSVNPDIKTWVLRNGVMLAQPVNLAGVPLALEYSLVDTRYTGGTRFFVDNTQELGVSVGTNRSANVAKSYARFGLRYLRGRESNAVTLSGSYWF